MIGFEIRWRVLNLNSKSFKDQFNVYKLPEEKNSIDSIEIFVLIRFNLNKNLFLDEMDENWVEIIYQTILHTIKTSWFRAQHQILNICIYFSEITKNVVEENGWN